MTLFWSGTIKNSEYKALALSLLILTGHVSAQSFWDMQPHEVRTLINKRIFSIEAEKPDVYCVSDVNIENANRITPLRIYTPSTHLNALPIVLLIHGGAWVAGNLDTHDFMARYLCKETQALVVSVDYCNSPEGKFPLPLEQCYDALLWTIENGPQFHANKTRLAVVGDSAGGNMAAALCLLARDRKGPNVDLQVLINPATDLTCNGILEKQGDSLDTLRWSANQYLINPNDAYNPYVSPLTAQDLSRLPPALVILAENDELRMDGQRYADRLVAAGVETQVYTQWGVGHLAGHAARASTVAKESLNVVTAALRHLFIKKTNQTSSVI